MHHRQTFPFGTILGMIGMLPLWWGTPLQAQPSPPQLIPEINFSPPPGHQGSPTGTGAGGSRGVCKEDQGNEKLTPLIPVSTSSTKVSPLGLTVSPYPSFFIYIPDTQAQNGEFVLTTADESRELYKINLALPEQAGIIRIQLPSAYPLEVGQTYKWEFSTICDPDDRSSDTFVSGEIERVNPPPNLVEEMAQANPLQQVSLYAAAGIWHETLEILADLRCHQMEDQSLAAIWKKLLTSEAVKRSEVSQVPLLDFCQR